MDDKTQSRQSMLPPNHGTISNSTNKRFSEVMAQYMQVHKISSLNPAVVSQAADYAGPQGDSYHQWDVYNPPTPTIDSRVFNEHQYGSRDQGMSVSLGPSSDIGMVTTDCITVSEGLSVAVHNTIRAPSIVAWPGRYAFQITMPTENRERNKWCYSTVKSRLYLCPKIAVPVSVSVNEWFIDGSITITPVYQKHESRMEPVNRCFNCKNTQVPERDASLEDHVVQVEGEGGRYEIVGERYQVSVPLQPPQMGEYASTILIKVMCLTSCLGGPNRRPFVLVFTLKNKDGEVIGRQILDVKCCKCPSRDMTNEEKQHAPRSVPQAPRLDDEKRAKNTSSDYNGITSPSLNNYNFSNWGKGDSSLPQGTTTEQCRDNVSTPESTPRLLIKEKLFHEQSPTSERAEGTDLISEASSEQREKHPSFKFLPAKHHLQLPGTSQKLSDAAMTSPTEDYAMTSFWDGYESQSQQTPSVLRKSEISPDFEATMEPDSLEKKPITTLTSIYDNSVKKSTYNSNTVASCLPHILMPDYTASPPYLPSGSCNYVTDIQEAQQRRGSNSSSSCIRTSQQNSHHEESSSHMRNSFSGSSRIPMASPGNEASYQPITTPIEHQVFDSLADNLKRDQKTRRNIWIAVAFMFVGVFMGIIALACLVKIGNKKFAPYNGMYPNGLNSTLS